MKEEDIRKRAVFDKYLKLVRKDSRKLFDAGRFVTVDCPACKSADYSRQFIKNGFQYVLCADCGTLFVNPRPAIRDIKKFYTDSPSSKFWVEEFFKPVAQARKEKIFKPRAEFLAKLFPRLNNPVIGDIGAGFGLFLEEIKPLIKGARCVAIEPSFEMAEICRNKGFEVISGILENIDKKYKNTFSILTSFELFEHLYNPELFLKKAYDVLAPGGKLLFTTLNGQGFDIQILWEKSKSIFPPHHLNLFNPAAVEIMLKKAGFKVIQIKTPGKLDWDILEGAYKVDGINIGRFWELVANNASDKAKKALQEWLSTYALSSHMMALAQK